MRKSDFIKLSSKELKGVIKKRKKELITLEDILFEVEDREYKEKHVTVMVKGCKGCQLEHCVWNNTCDHCDGYHCEDRLRK